MKNSFKKILLGVLSFLCVGICSLGISFSVNAETKNGTSWSELSLEKEYTYGTEFELPTRVCTIDGQPYKINGTLEYPDGVVTKNAMTKLTMAGVYTLKHSTIVNGKVYMQE